MVRLFERHRKRHVFTLDGLWKFRIDPEGKDLMRNGLNAFQMILQR